jgi:methylated-DNA-[protein]-cysteine S-methyltransferase
MPTVMSPTILASTMTTPIGPLTLLVNDGQVCAGGFTDDVDHLACLIRKKHGTAQIEVVEDLGPIAEALAAYFKGQVAALDTIPVSVQGGPFQERVWATLREIPPGTPTTYHSLAVRLGGEKLARAVGMGCATNLVSPIVPCHRVTRTNGNLAGYYWGLERKRWLLEHERRHSQGR